MKAKLIAMRAKIRTEIGTLLDVANPTISQMINLKELLEADRIVSSYLDVAAN